MHRSNVADKKTLHHFYNDDIDLLHYWYYSSEDDFNYFDYFD